MLPLITNLVDLPKYCLLGGNDDIRYLRNLRDKVTKQSGYFMLCKDTILQGMDTFVIKGVPGYRACTEWYLGRIKPTPDSPNFSYEVLVSRWNNDSCGNAYQYLCATKLDLSLVVQDLADNGDREFITPQGFAAWDQVFVDDFNDLCEYRINKA